MSTLFGTLGVAKSALSATQLAIQTTSNNVANAGTTGYTRQRVDLVEALPETLSIGQVGTGVAVDGIRRLRDQFLDQQISQVRQALGEYEAEQSTLAQIEALLGEPSENGLQESLSRFFTSLSDLASYPSDPTTRRAVLEQGQILAGDFNRLGNGLTDLKRNLESEIQTRVSEANRFVQEIASLNGQIQAVTIAGGSPNAFLDRRDAVMDDLAELVSITSRTRSDGTIQVSLSGGGGILVDGTAAGTLSARLSAGADAYELTLGDTLVTPRGGRLGGLFHSRNDSGEYVKYVESQLDALAATLVERMNRLQASGAGTAALATATSQNATSSASTPLVSAGLPFSLTVPGSFKVFVYDASTQSVTASGTVTVTSTTTLTDVATQLGGITGLSASTSGGTLTVGAAAGSGFRFASDTSNVLAALGLNAFFTGTNARTMAVNGALLTDPRLLSAASPDPTTGLVGAGDNSVALAMAGLRRDTVLDGGTATPSDYYAATIGVVGARAAAVNRLTESQSLILQTFQNRREQVSGVSIDEEMTDLIRYQRAFEASARMIQVVDELLDTVINRM
jgi:flagellar hook-associated protein 1 FlgK